MTTEQPRRSALTPTRSPLFQRFRRWEASGVLLAFLILSGALAWASPNFLTLTNIPILLRNASFVGIVGLGETLVILVGGIDLSVGTAAGLSAIIGALLLTKLGVNPYLIIPLTAAFGMALGLVNALFVAWLGLNPFIVTLASGEIFAGTILVITQGYPVRPLGSPFVMFGQTTIAGLPLPFLIFLASGLALWWMLTWTRFGRNIYAVGGNRDAAALVGIRVARVEVMVFGLAGMFAALAGILYASRMDAAQPTVGEGWMLTAITASILGGTSLRGGEGAIVGTMFGALLLTVLQEGTVLLNVSGYWERVIVGAVVLLAVLVDMLRRK